MKPFLKTFLYLFVATALLLNTTTQSLQASSANGSEPPTEAFKALPDEKSLLAHPQFIVIDDFNDGKLTNQRGAFWQTKSPADGALDLILQDSDARNKHRGKSLKISFHLKPKERAHLQSFLNRLDVSQAESLVFKCRYLDETSDYSGRLRVSLTDWKHKTVVQDISDLCPVDGNGWKDVVLPLSAFKGLDTDKLLVIEFALLARNETIKGDLQIDEVAFFGLNDVAFESLRDNLIGFPLVSYDERKREKLLAITDNKILLREIAKDTWKYFIRAKDKETFLIVDHIRTGDAPLAADYTSPTNVAMDLMVSVAAHELNFLSKKAAIKRIKDVFGTLNNLQQYQGFFYNFYDTKKQFVTRRYLSSIDNAWLAISLAVVRQAFPDGVGKEATRMLDGMNFEEFFDTETLQMVIGFDVPKREFGNFHYGMLVTEARAMSLLAIGKGDVPRDHWWYLFRTPPESWDWQNQPPQGGKKTADGIEYFQGYYEYNGKKFVPSWGGSLFEYLMPTLVLKERELAPEGLGLNNIVASQLHKEFALEKKGYPIWGISPAATKSGRRWKYKEFGVRALAVKGYPNNAVITPHVGFLALDSIPEEAIENIREMLKFEKIYGEYGFFDTVNLKNNKVNSQYLALDQGMILLAITNYLTNGAIQNYFHKDPIMKEAESLLEEQFFKI